MCVIFCFRWPYKLFKIRNMPFRGKTSRVWERTVCEYILRAQWLKTPTLSFIRGLGDRNSLMLLKVYLSSDFIVELNPNGSNFSVKWFLHSFWWLRRWSEKPPNVLPKHSLLFSSGTLFIISQLIIFCGVAGAENNFYLHCKYPQVSVLFPTFKYRWRICKCNFMY